MNPTAAPASFYSSANIRASKDLREKLLAKCVTEDDAKGDGFKSITHPFAVSRYARCLELEKAIADMGTLDHRLVLKNGRISIWRKK